MEKAGSIAAEQPRCTGLAVSRQRAERWTREVASILRQHPSTALLPLLLLVVLWTCGLAGVLLLAERDADAARRSADAARRAAEAARRDAEAERKQATAMARDVASNIEYQLTQTFLPVDTLGLCECDAQHRHHGIPAPCTCTTV